MTALEERAVIERVLAGDADAFEALVLENQKQVYNLALKMTGDEEDALDISQEAFVRAFLGLSGFKFECRFSVWLYRLTYNLCVDFIRKRRRAKVLPLTYVDDDGDFVDIEIPDPTRDPVEKAERREMIDAVESAISQLPPRHREIILMREITGMSYAEISAALGISEGTVKSRLSRARQNIVGILQRRGTFFGGGRQKGAGEV